MKAFVSAEFFDELKAVTIREQPVNDCGVKCLLFDGPTGLVECCATVAACAQVGADLAQQFPNEPVVIDNQYF